MRWPSKSRAGWGGIQALRQAEGFLLNFYCKVVGGSTSERQSAAPSFSFLTSQRTGMQWDAMWHDVILGTSSACTLFLCHISWGGEGICGTTASFREHVAFRRTADWNLPLNKAASDISPPRTRAEVRPSLTNPVSREVTPIFHCRATDDE